MGNNRIQCILVLAALTLLSSCSAVKVEYDAHAIIIDGQRKIINSGAIHYPRSTEAMWPDLFKKAKDGGLDAVETYIFWDRHEPVRRQYDFSGNLNFIKFFQLIQQAGLYAILRIGPYVCAEWTYGGFPLWLHNTPGIQLRTDNQIYKDEMQTFTTKIVDMVKAAKLFAPQGGPIILAQIENEYGNIMDGYGAAGKSYIKWCAQMAVAQNIGVPWIMCQQADAPAPMINTCNGFYCDQFTPNNPTSPKMFTENWVGWFKAWGGKDPYRTAEDCAFGVARFFQNGGILNNYYMFHGGTNFGRTAGGPYITTSYDYNALLDEYGNLNQPKYGHLKQLHLALKSGEKALTGGTATTKNISTNVQLTTYAVSGSGEKFCFLSNGDEKNDANADLGPDGKYFVPAWSVSILSNCNKEIYNTAKVASQTSIMMRKVNYKEDDDTPGKPEEEEQAPKLTWTWTAEPMQDTLQGRGRFKTNLLLDQKDATVDVSDYLWYMTSVDINNTFAPSFKTATLKVTSSGHGLNAFVNGKLIGTQFSKQANTQQVVKGDDYSFVFEKPVTLNPGPNIISLLSETVGLANYGAKYDLKPTGLVDGTVQLVSSDKKTIDLTSSTWWYKIGLAGQSTQRLFDPKSPSAKNFGAEKVPFGTPMTWYKTTFQSPLGTEAVVVDLLGMGKGEAWVNGNSLGRYWPSQVADNKGCSNTCDYRGAYNPEKCQQNCGQPTQRWYHVPRSFLNANGPNTLVLFEEIGGNPSNVSFQIVTIGTVCGYAYEGTTLELACQGSRIMVEILYAGFGDPTGSCGSFQKGTFEAPNSMPVVTKACVGKPSCSIDVSQASFGGSKLPGPNKLAVQASCG